MKNLNKKIGLVIVALLFFQITNAQVIFEWGSIYDGGSTDKALLVTPAGESFIHFAGTRSVGGGTKIYTRKYSTSGILKWSRTGNTFLPGNLLFIQRDASFGTYVICVSGGSYALIKYGIDGTQKWIRTITENPVGLKIVGSHVYTGGQSGTGFFARSYKASNGATEWSRVEANGRAGRGFDADNSGNIYLGGIDGSVLDEMMYIVKFNSSSLSPIWTTTYMGDDLSGRDNVHLLTVDVAGNVYATGEIDAYGSMLANVSMAKFNSAGVNQWKHYIRRAGGPVGAIESKLVLDWAQNPILTGQANDFYNVNPSQETSRIFVTKLNRNTGAELFDVLPNDPLYTNTTIIETPASCFLDQFGNIYIGGSGNNGGLTGDVRWTITKVDGVDGSLRWIEAGSSLIGGKTNNVFVSTGGDVYLANEETFTTSDFEVQKFSQPGGGLRLIVSDENKFSVMLYPNPSNEKFSLQLEKDLTIPNIIVYDISGKIIEEYKNVVNGFTFGDKISPGIYFLSLISGDQGQTLRFIKTE